MDSKSLHKLKAIDLFSGCGGLTQGLKDAGFDVLACCEIRPEARETYALNHPMVRLYEDIRELHAEAILTELNFAKGELDLLAACPPCQGFSSMRTKNGAIAKDARNELIFEVQRLIEGLLPKFVLIENVPRLLKDERLSQFKEALSHLGYHFSEGVLDAQDFGVAQRRKRMILICSRTKEVGLPKQVSKKRVVRDVLFDLPDPDTEHEIPLHRLRQRFTPKTQERIDAIQRNRTELPDHLVLECHRRYPVGFKDVYGRLSWDEVSSTITRSSHNPSKGRFLHPVQNRALTLHEAMLLQGFPNSYRFPETLGIGKISSMIGEAFPPPMAAAQARHVKKRLLTL